MSSRKLRSSRDSLLSKLNQKKKVLEKSRIRVVTELELIDYSLKQIQAEYGKILNDTCPLLNLPTEVMCMIFDLAVSHIQEDHDTKKEHSLSEVDISHVCKRWRDISLNYPQMWTRFFFFANNVESMRNSLNRFDLYLKRSKAQNLELFIDFREDDFERQRAREAEQYELMDMAISVVERWKIVTFFSDLDPHIEVHLGSKLIAASAPNLQYFSYSPDAAAYPHSLAKRVQSDLLYPAIFKEGAPKLQYLLLGSSIFKMPSFSNITTLRLEIDVNNIMASTCYPWEIFLEILSIPSLTNLSMVGTVFITPEASGIPTIPMNNLKHLRYSDDDYMTFLLPFLRAPLLETLTIRNDQALDEEFEPNPFGLVEQDYSFPSLHTLTLIDSPSSPDWAWRLMELTKNITSILIFDITSDPDFFTALTEHAPFNNQCWPKLATITARIDSWYEIDVLNDLARTRPKKSLNLRLSKETCRSCQAHNPGPFGRLMKEFNVEAEEEAETALMRPMWPPGTDCPDYAFLDDPFQLEKMS